MLRSFFAYGSDFGGGVWVAVGDMDGDGDADVVSGAGAGGGPNVAAFSGIGNTFYRSFFPFAVDFVGGAYVASQPSGNGRWAIVTGQGTGGAQDVKVYDGLTLEQLDQFFSDEAVLHGAYFALAGP